MTCTLPPILRKVILAATANVRNNTDDGYEMKDSDLFITELLIDEGPTMKRIRPRAQGRAYRINKRMSHIKVIVGSL